MRKCKFLFTSFIFAMFVAVPSLLGTEPCDHKTKACAVKCTDSKQTCTTQKIKAANEIKTTACCTTQTAKCNVPEKTVKPVKTVVKTKTACCTTQTASTQCTTQPKTACRTKLPVDKTVKAKKSAN
jgi:hypothetical protein